MKRKSIVLHMIAILLICFTMPTIAGCIPFWEWDTISQLSAVEAAFDETKMELSWKIDPEAVIYQVVVNQKAVITITDWDNSEGYLYYDFRNALTDDESVYRFYVKATDSNSSARKSEDFVYEKPAEDIDVATINYNKQKSPSGLEYEASNSCISWNAVSGAENYVAIIASSNEDVRYVKTSEKSLNLYKYLRDDAVFMVNVGVQFGETLYLDDSNELYFSTENDEEALIEYKSKVFYFDGVYYDYYINSQSELDALFYYAYIQKLETVQFQTASYFVTTKPTLTQKLNTSKNKLYETYVYNVETQMMSLVDYIFSMTFDFFGQEEPTKTNATSFTTFTPTYQSIYKTYNEDDLGVENFASDSRPMNVLVTTSDQLCHVVEHGARPKFNSTTSSAYKMYQAAKEELNKIISPNMTDYEKALAIFDYLVQNVVYDYNVTNAIAIDDVLYGNETAGTTTTAYKCFFLEGVFEDGIAVCDGYSKAFSLMCNMLDIECYRITGLAGTTTKGGHAWNKVKIGGDWYVVDITWSNTKGSNVELSTHSYFMVPDSYVQDTHIASDSSTYLTMPAVDDSLLYYTAMTYEVGQTSYDRFINQNLSTIITSIKNHIAQNESYALEVLVDVQIYEQFVNSANQQGVSVINSGFTMDYSVGASTTSAYVVILY